MLLPLAKGISTGKLKIYTIDGSKYCAKDGCITIVPVPRRHKHLSSSANRPSDVVVTVNINVESNLIIICWQLTPELNAFQGMLALSIATF